MRLQSARDLVVPASLRITSPLMWALPWAGGSDIALSISPSAMSWCRNAFVRLRASNTPRGLFNWPNLVSSSRKLWRWNISLRRSCHPSPFPMSIGSSAWTCWGIFRWTRWPLSGSSSCRRPCWRKVVAYLFDHLVHEGQFVPGNSKAASVPCIDCVLDPPIQDLRDGSGRVIALEFVKDRAPESTTSPLHAGSMSRWAAAIFKIMPLNRNSRFAAANRHRQRLVTGHIGGHGMNCGQRIGELDSAARLEPRFDHAHHESRATDAQKRRGLRAIGFSADDVEPRITAAQGLVLFMKDRPVVRGTPRGDMLQMSHTRRKTEGEAAHKRMKASTADERILVTR